jgi:ATP-dependent protease HslVU (ClpYQ) peptidase subunit
MTIIVALQTDKNTYIGSDTCLVAGDRKLAGNYQKWVVHRNWAIGFAGCWKVFNIIQLNYRQLLTGLKYPEDFIKKLEVLLNDNNVGKHEEYTVDYGQNLLLAKKNSLVWHLDPLLAISEIPKDMLWAEGSGAEYAIGCGFALANRSPEERMERSIEAAKEFCVNCGGETFIRKL